MIITAERNPNYFLQSQLGPIALITVLSAASYYNDLAAYDARMTVIASSLLSMMALQAYVSASLPMTSTITFVNYCLCASVYARTPAAMHPLRERSYPARLIISHQR